MAAPATVLSGWFLARKCCCVEQTLCKSSKCELQLQFRVRVFTYWLLRVRSVRAQYIDIGGCGLRSIQVHLVLFKNISFWLFHTDIHINWYTHQKWEASLLCMTSPLLWSYRPPRYQRQWTSGDFFHVCLWYFCSLGCSCNWDIGHNWFSNI